MMTYHESKKPGFASEEDLDRLNRLQEEISGRAEEIARIISRYLDKEPLFPIEKFSLTIDDKGGYKVGFERSVGGLKIVGSMCNPPGMSCPTLNCPC